ncbi:MAG: hypothetical protein R2796_01160 [Chitinophagaceae bacterium]|nr:hypothetical protein [Chitinophagaceae bacterium]MCB0739484.1 hypothetical protein [Chitinophagaceae bacterium]HQV06152.1 hypothetical protein [Chitinophagaceae bacterium]
MKYIFSKSFILALSVIFSCLIFITSCHKNEKKEIFHLTGEIAKPADKFGMPDIFGKVLSGSAYIYNLGSGEIIIALTQNNEAAANNKFILQTNKPSTYKTGISTLQNVEIMYLYDIVLVNDLDKNILTSYAVHSKNYTETFNLIPKLISEKITNNNFGYGLAFNNSPWPFINNNIDLNKSINDYFKIAQKTNIDPPGGGSPCTAGGEGSTSCSISCTGGYNCSTTCETGYHSCCYCADTPPDDYGPHCDCVKNE